MLMWEALRQATDEVGARHNVVDVPRLFAAIYPRVWRCGLTHTCFLVSGA